MTDYAERVPNLLHHQLTQAGHRSFFTEKTLLDLGMDVERISRFVREVRADAWVVASGSRDVLQWFASQEVPADVSLVCTDGHHTFTWCRPTIAHIRWDYRPVLRRIVRWANHIARGKEDRRQTLSKAEFVDGETVGPAPKR
ncbi:MAG: hypothetical protein ACO3JG_03040 [Luteolibacter sp.]